MPSWHDSHSRSEDVDPSVSIPSPTLHVCHAKQSPSAWPSLNCPGAHSEQWLLDSPSRRLCAVCICVVVAHAPQARSDMCVPTGHSCHTVQARLPAVALNWPVAQVTHVRSLVDVAATEMASPEAQGSLTVVQTFPSLFALYVCPATHGKHSRFETAEPALDSPSPAAHVCQATQPTPCPE